ncbi:membrane protein YczE [Microbacterium sp. GXF7504]
MTRRILQLALGLPLYGFGCALTVLASLGVDPWTVLAQGVSRQTGIGIGWVVNGIGLLVMLLWIPLRQRPGVGTLANILVVGSAMQVALWLLPAVDGFVPRLLVLLAGIVCVAVASGLYIGAHFGAGPRDGLMTGLTGRFGWPTWLARGSVELSVLLGGWLLGGDVGLGTVLFAVLIGPLVHLTLPVLDTRRERAPQAAPRHARTAPGTLGGHLPS